MHRTRIALWHGMRPQVIGASVRTVWGHGASLCDAQGADDAAARIVSAPAPPAG